MLISLTATCCGDSDNDSDDDDNNGDAMTVTMTMMTMMTTLMTMTTTVMRWQWQWQWRWGRWWRWKDKNHLTAVVMTAVQMSQTYPVTALHTPPKCHTHPGLSIYNRALHALVKYAGWPFSRLWNSMTTRSTPDHVKWYLYHASTNNNVLLQWRCIPIVPHGAIQMPYYNYYYYLTNHRYKH